MTSPDVDGHVRAGRFIWRKFMLKRYRSFIDALVLYEGYFCILTLAVMVLLNIVEIVSRNLFSRSFSGTQELSVLLGSWMVFSGAAYVFSKSNLLNVDFLVSRLKGRLRCYYDIVLNVFITFILLVFMRYGNELRVIQAVRKTEALHLSASLYVVSLLVSCVLMLLAVVLKFMESAASLKSMKGGSR